MQPKVYLDPVKREWVTIDLGDGGILPVHPYKDFARNLELAEFICASLTVRKANSVTCTHPDIVRGGQNNWCRVCGQFPVEAKSNAT